MGLTALAFSREVENSSWRRPASARVCGRGPSPRPPHSSSAATKSRPILISLVVDGRPTLVRPPSGAGVVELGPVHAIIAWLAPLRGSEPFQVKEVSPMKRLVIVAFVIGLGFGPAHAQEAPTTAQPAPSPAAPQPAPPPAAPQPAPPATAAPAAASPSAKQTAKQVRAQCRAQAKAQGLTGSALKGAVQDCFAKARPDLAQAQQCRQQGKAKGLADTQLKAFVRQCKAGVAQ
jgi:pyruvate/2-oxoglutarate dehydrogenase complex dihydrolipoamide acyltransferase (E2) component